LSADPSYDVYFREESFPIIVTGFCRLNWTQCRVDEIF